MINYYTKYIEPILNSLPLEARNELENSYSFQDCVKQTNKNVLFSKKRSIQETYVSDFYWRVARLYTNSQFMDSFNNVQHKQWANIIDSETGKLSIPNKFHSIFETKRLDSGQYICRVRQTQPNYRFNVIPNQGKDKAIYDAICNISQLPLLPIDERLISLEFIIENSALKYVRLQKNDKYRGHKSDIEEISAESNKRNSILKVQEKIHAEQNKYAVRLQSAENRINAVRDEQNVTINNLQKAFANNASSKEICKLAQHMINATKEYEDFVKQKDKLQTEQQETINALKRASGLPFEKLHSLYMRQK